MTMMTMSRSNTLLLFLFLLHSFVLSFNVVRQHHPKTSLAATWSNGQAVQDYQSFLSSGKQELDLTRDGASVLLVAEPSNDGDPLPALPAALREMGMGDDAVIIAGEPLPPQMGDGRSEYPIYLCFAPTGLSDFLQNLPESYRDRVDDFVFVSGGLEFGNVEDVLKDRGYCRDAMTQVVISGMKILPNGHVEDVKAYLGPDASGEDKLAGECTACGKWAGSIAERLERSNVVCKTDFYREWRRKMWERSVFDAVFNLIGAIRDKPTTIADVAKYYEDEVSDILWEMSQKLRGWRAITLLYGFEERLLGFGEASGEDQPCVLTVENYDFVWGSPVFLESKTFVEYLQYAQTEKGLLPGIALPVRDDDSYTSNMLQGNLRADGVV